MTYLDRTSIHSLQDRIGFWRKFISNDRVAKGKTFISRAESRKCYCLGLTIKSKSSLNPVHIWFELWYKGRNYTENHFIVMKWGKTALKVAEILAYICSIVALNGLLLNAHVLALATDSRCHLAIARKCIKNFIIVVSLQYFSSPGFYIPIHICKASSTSLIITGNLIRCVRPFQLTSYLYVPVWDVPSTVMYVV